MNNFEVFSGVFPCKMVFEGLTEEQKLKVNKLKMHLKWRSLKNHYYQKHERATLIKLNWARLHSRVLTHKEYSCCSRNQDKHSFAPKILRI